MKKKILPKFIFEGFGFPIVLKDVIIEKVGEDEFPEINYNELKIKTVKALIITSKALTGAQLQFFRKFVDQSLREFADHIEVSHAQIKNWEDRPEELTGLTQNQERKIKNLVLNFLLSQEQKFYYDRLLTQEIEKLTDQGPLDPYSVDLKFG